MLILVDLQNDYFDPKGKFYFKDSKRIIKPIIKRCEEAHENNEVILGIINQYDNTDPRSKEEIKWAQDIYDPFKKYYEDIKLFEKYTYGLSAEDINSYSLPILEENEEIEIVGVETDLCVLSNAVIFQSIYPTTRIVINKENVATSRNIFNEVVFLIMANLKMKII